MTASERLFDVSRAFSSPVTVGIVVAVIAGLLLASLSVRVLRARGVISEPTFGELIARTRSWYVLATALVVPILLGAAWVWGGFLLLSLFCFREFARATGIRESRTATYGVLVAIGLTYFAVIDHWMGLFTASWALGIALITVLGLLPDQPEGYIQRTALAIVGFALFGISLGHLAYFSNDAEFRPILLWILVGTELNDVFAYLAGKTFGKRKLVPNTSPNKTWGGAVGAVLLTTLLVAGMGHFVFKGSPLDSVIHLLALGVIVSVLGQCGDLVISSIKRDLGVKDMATLIPGHGGLLDRFDSLLLVAPTVFHYVNYFRGVGAGQTVCLITGG